MNMVKLSPTLLIVALLIAVPLIDSCGGAPPATTATLVYSQHIGVNGIEPGEEKMVKEQP